MRAPTCNYTLSHTHCGAWQVLCLYCPEDAAVKQKMLYSTAKSALIQVAAELSVSISIKLEVTAIAARPLSLSPALSLPHAPPSPSPSLPPRPPAFSPCLLSHIWVS